MKKIITASTNRKVIDTVLNVCKLYPSIFTADVYDDTEAIINHIDYELPEIKVLDFSSDDVDCFRILNLINRDTWLHYGGVIAVCKDRAQLSELEQLKDMNMLSIQTVENFSEHFVRILRILYQNQQFLFNRGMRDIAGGQEAGTFICGNDPMDLKFYTNFLVSYLYNTDRISNDDRVCLQMTFNELLTNALEHGNLEIGFEDKSKCLSSGGNILQLIEERSKNPNFANRKIHVSYVIGKNSSKFSIKDEGKGFDWRQKSNMSGSDSFHGRGISLSMQMVKTLTYNEKGNEVSFSIDNQINQSNTIPDIMSSFPSLKYQNHQVVCKEGEISTDLYFIIAGRFAVYAQGKLASVLTPNDLFIGEMAFLLNDRRTATVIAIGECKLIKVPKGDFLALIRKNPHYGIFLSKMLARRLAKQTSNMITLKEQILALGGNPNPIL